MDKPGPQAAADKTFDLLYDAYFEPAKR